jgi:hypothetical protein
MRFLWVILIFTACNLQNKTVDSRLERTGDAKSLSIIDRAIATHGGERYQIHDIEFDFRDRHYRSKRNQGIYTYERIFTDSTGQQIHDILNNEGLTRYINETPVEITDERKNAYSNSVNSVIYFALLPYFLNDPAVQSEYIGEATIANQPYEKIKVQFRQEGGGTDFQDEFVYWFHRDRYTLDYLAYNYQTDGGGSRFRRAMNVRVVGGIRFADYVNYKPEQETMYIFNFDSLYQAGVLDSLSSIIIENITVH